MVVSPVTVTGRDDVYVGRVYVDPIGIVLAPLVVTHPSLKVMLKATSPYRASSAISRPVPPLLAVTLIR
jgi:hypothetical protein